MAMLAERRSKQKWSLNPRGNQWSSDQNKFGQKILEKLGWKDGKGLGANEDGVTQHVKVAYKNDQKGMGFKDTDTQWTSHEDHFSKLLQGLQKSEDAFVKKAPETTKLSSLVEKSEKSRARVHYRKFTRGKDLSRYTEKDLANVFGRTKLQKDVIVDEAETIGDDVGAENKEHGVVTLKGGSMVDYFRKKMGAFCLSESQSGDFVCENKSDDDRPSFGGLGHKSVESFMNNADDCSYKTLKTTGLGYNGKVSDVTHSNDYKMSFVKSTLKEDAPKLYERKDADAQKKRNANSFTEENSVATESPSTKFSRKRNTSITIEESDDNVEPSLKSIHAGDVVAEKKKKKKRNAEALPEETPSKKHKIDDESPKSSKKKRKSEKLAFKELEDEQNLHSLSSPFVETKKEATTADLESCSEFEISHLTSKKGKKDREDTPRKKCKKNGEIGISNKAFDPFYDGSKIARHNLNTICEDEELQIEEKVGKKKNGENKLNPFLTNDEEDGSSKKKKSKKPKGIDNPCLNLSAEADDEVTSKSSKKAKKQGIDNPCLESYSPTENDASKKSKKKKLKEDDPFLGDEEVKSTKKSKKNKLVNNPFLENGLMGEEEAKKSKKHKVILENGLTCEDEAKKPKKHKQNNPFLENAFTGDDEAKKPKKNKQNDNPFLQNDLTAEDDSSKKNKQNDKEAKKSKKNKLVDNPFLENGLTAEEESTKKPKKHKQNDNPFLENVFTNDGEAKKPKKNKPVDNPFLENRLTGEETKRSKKDKLKAGIDNPCLETVSLQEETNGGSAENPFEEKRSDKKKKKKKSADEESEPQLKPPPEELRGINNPAADEDFFAVSDDLMLNTVYAPDAPDTDKGQTNRAFGTTSTRNPSKFRHRLDNAQAQVENDLNEAKATVFIGEAGTGVSRHVRTEEGVKLSYRIGEGVLSTRVKWAGNDTGAKKSYKHLIKGDVVVCFKNTNLHEIIGYGGEG